MKDTDCVHFLQWALPMLQMRWAGFRKVRKRVCKRISHRLAELELDDISAYQQFLKHHPDEWQQLDSLCRVVVSRFYRDRGVFEKLAENELPSLANTALANGRKLLSAWSVGSASGEEAYTLAILWQNLLALRFPNLQLSLIGTEVEPKLLERSQQACYPSSTIKELPEHLRKSVFEKANEQYCLKQEYKNMVVFRQQDIRTDLPGEIFDLILCRNLVFTYYDESMQQHILKQMLSRLHQGGLLVLGVHESLPSDHDRLAVVSKQNGFYRHASSLTE